MVPNTLYPLYSPNMFYHNTANSGTPTARFAMPATQRWSSTLPYGNQSFQGLSWLRTQLSLLSPLINDQLQQVTQRPRRGFNQPFNQRFTQQTNQPAQTLNRINGISRNFQQAPLRPPVLPRLNAQTDTGTQPANPAIQPAQTALDNATNTLFGQTTQATQTAQVAVNTALPASPVNPVTTAAAGGIAENTTQAATTSPVTPQAPSVAIIDFGFEKEQGHGSLVREVIESQLGTDGKQVTISTFGDSKAAGENGQVTIQQLISALEQAADKTKDASYNYVNLSWGSDKLQPTQLIEIYTQSLEGQLNTFKDIKPQDLSAKQKQDLVNYAVSYAEKHKAQPSATNAKDAPEVNQDLINLGRIYNNVLTLMRSGSQVYHAAPNKEDIYDAVSLLDGFNDGEDGRFYTVGRQQGSIFDSTKNLTVADREENTTGLNQGIDIWAADQLRKDAQGSSFATAEAIVNHLVNTGKVQLVS